jgi:hypothetical protein
MKRLLVSAIAVLCAAVPALGAEPPAPTYSKEISRIFQEKCQVCHHAGTSAPMSLMTFEEVRPWVRAIRSRVEAREMPPWHIDRTVGIRKFKNDRGLSEAEIKTVLRWADLGAPAGDPKDLPPARTFTDDAKWFIGKPDLIVTTDSEHVMYAKGQDWWIDQFGDTGLTEDRWIQAMEMKPTNGKIVHHAVSFLIDPNPAPGTPAGGEMLHEYAVGKFGDLFAENTGRLMKAGSRVRFDMHYFAMGSEQKNRMQIAFKFYPKGFVPKYQVRSIGIRNLPEDELDVPPNTVARTDAYFRLPKNARIDSFQPHMHMRGKQMWLESINLDNTTTLISSVDHFSFNWHINYVYADDVAPLLPAGTVLHVSAVHDNTTGNRLNPNSNAWVGYGERSVDDMLFLWLDVVYLTDEDYQGLMAQRKATGPSPTANHGQQ